MLTWLPSGLLDAFPGVVAICTLDGTVVEASQRVLAAGSVREGLKVWSLDLWSSSVEVSARVRDSIERAAHGEHVRFETFVRGERGVVYVSPVADASGVPRHVAVFGLDPGELALGSDIYRVIFEAAADGIFVADRDGRYIEANERGCAMVGYTREELLRLTVWDVADSSTPPDLAAIAPTLRSERVLRCKDGTLVPVELTAVKLPDGTVIGMARDISQRRQADEALRQREEELESLSDATHEALFIHRDGVILATNRAARELYRLPPDGAVGRNLFELVAPESVDMIRQRIATASAELYEAFGLRADGTSFPAAVQARTTTFRGRPARITAIRDLTEVRALQSSLAFADRMASVGTLAAGVAHEINNPLTFITAGLDLVMQRLDAGHLDVAARAEMLEILRDAQDGASRITAIVRDLKAFSRADDETTGTVELEAAIRYAVRIAAAEIKHRAKLVLDLPPLPYVTGNETRLGQVFLNLLVNAAHAIPQGAADQNQITISARAEADRVVVAISDTGVGMEPSLVQRIFDPFVTTKSHGTGLGLAISHGIVTRLGGSIEVESAPGNGTTFRVAFPVARLAATEHVEHEASGPADALSHRLHLLIVDDEPLLVKAAARVLEPDCDVVIATSAREALARFEQGERFDVILCDLLMPVMTGMDLFERVKDRWPEIAERFVFLTGGVFSQPAAAFLERCGRPCLDKPFKTTTLLEIVRDVAGQPA